MSGYVSPCLGAEPAIEEPAIFRDAAVRCVEVEQGARAAKSSRS
jgi:hypothetical protein